MQTKLEEKKKILNFVSNFSNIAKKENWVARYDLDTKAFSFSSKKMPDDIYIKYFSDEFALYITKDNKIKGIFIEYCKNNFIKHHKEAISFKKLLLNIEKGKSKNKSLVELKKNGVNKKVISELEDAIQESLAKKINLEALVC